VTRASHIVVAAAIALGLSAPARADVSVPIDVQVELVQKIVRFERTFAGRRPTPALILCVAHPAAAASVRATSQFTAGVRAAAKLADRPIEVRALSYRGTRELIAAASVADVVYFGPGLQAQIAEVAAALRGLPVLTIAAADSDVERGAILGFELQGARPRILVNLPQARAQGVDLDATLLRLAKVLP
jgi:hypothetical protein